MKIEQKIVMSNIFNVALMALIGIFAFQGLNIALTKLRFVEIADDLNASFLEMRLSEKNFFLYKDASALGEIQEKIKAADKAVAQNSSDIEKAVGSKEFMKLRSYLDGYSKSCDRGGKCEATLRAEGKRLREFSDSMTRLERSRVGSILSTTKFIMMASMLAIILSAIVASHFVSQKILQSLRKIEGLANTIAAGNFEKIEVADTGDELGTVIKAVNSMSEELGKREEELLQSKKLASMGILTAGVAHEITNPVNNISMIAQTYAEVYESLSSEDRIEFMSKVESEADRIKGIVRNLLDFSKPKKADLGDVDLNEVVRGALSLVQNMLDIGKVEVGLTLSDGLPHVMADKNQIQQVLVNLMVNAAQAMPEGGRLDISTWHCTSDTGEGIPAELLPHLFDPFFSTKGVGGTGLGLSVSYGIIKNHNGNIRVDSELGTGTTFTVELPVSNEKPEAWI
jgi:two-component system NtrC family sensor kinase